LQRNTGHGIHRKIHNRKDFVRKIRPESGVIAVLRYETKPGVKSQVDWSEFGRVKIDVQTKKLYCFNMILGYSRMRYIEFTLSIDAITLIKCHLNAFRYFGGYTDEILYDNMKQVVIHRALKSSESTWHSKFDDFYKYYGFLNTQATKWLKRVNSNVHGITH